MIPDFVYSYNPYLRYSIFKYAYTPTISKARLILDVENELKTKELSDKYNTKKTDLLKEAGIGIKQYFKKVHLKIQKKMRHMIKLIKLSLN